MDSSRDLTGPFTGTGCLICLRCTPYVRGRPFYANIFEKFPITTSRYKVATGRSWWGRWTCKVATAAISTVGAQAATRIRCSRSTIITRAVRIVETGVRTDPGLWRWRWRRRRRMVNPLAVFFFAIPVWVWGPRRANANTIIASVKEPIDVIRRPARAKALEALERFRTHAPFFTATLRPSPATFTGLTPVICNIVSSHNEGESVYHESREREE
mmetsp:Transcript_33975/g.84689  ORF Transcript_33975/g.84689 Transcript_33975/m.84689 type:complete len:214 (-) Transcript_33975:70-711(-)